MQPPMISFSIHGYETSDCTIQSKSAWTAELVASNHSNLLLLTANRCEQENPASGYILIALLALLIVISCSVKPRILQEPQLRTQPSPQKTPPTSPASSPKDNLHLRLVHLLHGNESTANRLLRHSHISHPNRSQQWHYEQVIQDILRDRR